MSKFEIVNEYGYDYNPILNKVLEYALKEEKVKNAIFTIIFVDENKIHELNYKYRGIDRATDVLSFAYEDSETDFGYDGVRILGEIFVCIPKMMEQAKEYEHSETRELCFLCVHGLLHLLGYDHMQPDDEKIMFGRQELILNEFEETRKEKI
jgi:probable rRNA maturation factor